MVLASDIYEEADYMRVYDDFLAEFARREAAWRQEWTEEIVLQHNTHPVTAHPRTGTPIETAVLTDASLN